MYTCSKGEERGRRKDVEITAKNCLRNPSKSDHQIKASSAKELVETRRNFPFQKENKEKSTTLSAIRGETVTEGVPVCEREGTGRRMSVD